MNRNLMSTRSFVMILVGLFMLTIAPAGSVFADEFTIDCWTIDGGGGMFCEGYGYDFELSGTIGQPDAGVMTGGDFELAGGFWCAAGGTASPCPADITDDGVVDVLDLLEVLSQWGGSGSADITGDGIVDVLDLLEVLAAWGACE